MNADLKNRTPDIRRLKDMESVVYDKKWLETAGDFDLYYMYRGIKKNGDLRYDITIIPPKMLGKEFVKTKGHSHLGKYGEIYMVLEGEAIYLMQKEENGKISDVYSVKAGKQDVIIIPSSYGHITINPSKKKELKMANWVCNNCKSDYSLYEKMNGACYFYTEDGWIKNDNYKKIPLLRFEKPLESLPKDLNFLSQG